MKSLLLLLLLAPTVCLGQVYKFKAISTKMATFNGQEYVTNETHKVEFLVVINIDKQKINTYGKAEGDYDIIKTTSTETKDDGSVIKQFTAIDERGEKCTVALMIYSDSRKDQDQDGCVATLGVTQGNILLVFYLKKDD